MKNIVRSWAILTLLAGGAMLPSAGHSQSAATENARQNAVLPDDLVEHIHLQHFLFPDRTRQEIVADLRDLEVTEGLDRRQRFFLAEFYFLSLQGRPAFEIFSHLRERDDWYSRVGLQRIMVMLDRALDDPDGLATTIEEYEALPVNDEDILSGFWGYQALARRAEESGDPDTAIAIVERAVRRYPKSLPYGVFLLPRDRFSAYQAANREAEAFRLIEEVSAGLSDAIADRRSVENEHPTYQAGRFDIEWKRRWLGEFAGFRHVTDRMQELVELNDAFLRCHRDGETASCNDS